MEILSIMLGILSLVIGSISLGLTIMQVIVSLLKDKE